MYISVLSSFFDICLSRQLPMTDLGFYEEAAPSRRGLTSYRFPLSCPDGRPRWHFCNILSQENVSGGNYAVSHNWTSTSLDVFGSLLPNFVQIHCTV